MAFREATAEYVFQSVSGANVTMPTAANFAQLAPFIPAVPSRQWKNVSVVVSARHHDTFLANGSNWSVGVTLDGGTREWYRATNQYFNSGEHFWWFASQDLTTQWESAWSSTSKETGTVDLSFSFTGGTWGMGNFQAKLWITYEWDDNNQPLSGTLLKTVKIPIQSKTTTLTTTAEEFGGAGSWSIPVLDTFLPESGKVIEDAWVEFFSSDASVAATAFGLRWTWNGATEQNIVAENQDANSSLSDWYIIKLKHPDGTFPSNIPPRLLVRGSDVTTARYNTAGGFLGVTYRYSASSNRILNSLMLSMGEHLGMVGGDSAQYNRLETKLNIQEPGPITVKNSGVMLSLIDAANMTTNMRFGSENATTSSLQSFRQYTITAGTLTCGNHFVTQRVDSGSLAGTGLVLDRGENTLWVDFYNSTTIGTGPSAIALLNYESSCSISGAAAHNHTTVWLVTSGTTTSSGSPSIRANNLVKVPRWQHPPALSGSQWFHNNSGLWLQSFGFFGGASMHIDTEDDNLANTFVPVGSTLILADGENSNLTQWYSTTDLFWRHAQEPFTGSYFDPRRPRQWKIMSATFSWHNLWWFQTTHNIGYPVSASVKRYRDSAQGIVVNVHRQDTKANLYRVTASANGAYSFLAYDNVTPLYAHATQSINHVGTSETSAPSTIPSS